MMLTGTGTRDLVSQKGLNYFSTPFVAIRTLMRHEKLPHVILEPMAGSGAIVKPLRDAGHKVVASDLVDRECPDCEAGVDFLRMAEAPSDVGALVSNPPYNACEGIIHHAVYNLRIPKVYMLLRWAFMEGGNLKNQKGEWRRQILDGGHLAKVLLFRARLPYMHRPGFEGKKLSNSGMPMGWFCWDLAHQGVTIVERISYAREPDPYAQDAVQPEILRPTPLEAYIAAH